MAADASHRIVVVGGGISGLAAALRVQTLDPRVELTLLEAAPRLGGVLDTVKRNGFLIERSADNFIGNLPWAVDLCRELGLANQLIPTSSQKRNAMVVRRGRLERVPAGFLLLAPTRAWPILTSPLLSPWGKLRLLCEYFVPRRREAGDESLASFARRRLGREAFERIVQPLVAGIYAADPQQLSLAATLPRFLEMERRHGSLIAASRHPDREAASPEESGARYGMFVTLRDGLGSLVAAAAEHLPAESIRLNAAVQRITRNAAGGWQVNYTAAGSSNHLDCDAVIVALPAPRASRVLADVDRELAADLGRIEYAGTSIVSLGFRRRQIGHPLDGFGFVVPAVEKRRILAGSFASVKFAGRAPEDHVLVRVFIGGALQHELAELPDEELQALALAELGDLLHVTGEPLLVDIARWPATMPQYHLGHCQLVAAIERRAADFPTLALAGNAYHGVGIPHCIHSGQQAADRVLAQLRAPAPS